MQSFELESLIRNYNLTEIKVLSALKDRLDFNNRIKTFKQAEIATEIGYSQSNVSRAIKKLKNDNILVKDGLKYYFNEKFIKDTGDNNKV